MQTQANTASKAGDGVEVTPEMIAAGREIVWHSQIEYPTDQNMGEMVKRIFEAMNRARP